MNGPSLVAMNGRLGLWSNDVNQHEGTITTCVEVVKHLLRLRCYAVDAVFAKSDEEIRGFKQASLTTWDYSKLVQDLTLQCCGLYNEQTLEALFAKCIGLSTRSTMCRWWADKREASLDDLVY